MSSKSAVSFEDALNLTGFGKYNYALLVACMLTLLSAGSDVFSMSFIVPACACDLNISVSQRGILTAIPFFGTVCTLFLWGYLADRKGRRTILIYSMIGSSVFGFLSSFSPNWIVMAALRFLSACFSSGSNSIVYVLLGECCPGRHRSKLLLFMTAGLSFCQSISGALSIPILPLGFSYELGFLGIYYKPWRLLVQLLAIPSVLSALSMIFFFESPRFLASVGREEEAIAVLTKIHTINTGKDAETYEIKALSLDEIVASRNISFLFSLWSSVKIMFRPPLLKYTILLYWLSVINYSVNTGTVMWQPFIMNGFFNHFLSGSASESLNICGLLDKARNTDIITNVTESIYIEPVCDDIINPVTAFTAIALAVYGFVLNGVVAFIPHKKYIAVVLFILSGIIGFLINVIFIPVASVILIVLFVSTGGVNGIVSIYYVELFPTSVRGTASSLGIMVGRISGFTCITVTGYYIDNYCSTIFQIFGALFLVGGISSLLLPNYKQSKKV